MKKIISITALSLFLITMFFSLFHMSSKMEMGQKMSDCMFMSHEEVMCPMNVLDHINAWQSVFLSIPTTDVSVLTILLFVSITPIFLFKLCNALLQQILPYIRQRMYNFCCRPLQELFSNGILHPKVF